VRTKIETRVLFKADTVITDATISTFKLKYPQDSVLLKQARLNLEVMTIDMTA
jgi:hypothetical protein